MKAPLGAWLVLSSSRQAQAGGATLCSLGGRQGSAKAEGPPSSHPAYPSPAALHAQPLPGSPLLYHSWCCCATISCLCRCRCPVRAHATWLCLSARARGVRTETLAGGHLTSHHLTMPNTAPLIVSHCHSLASTFLSVKWGHNDTHFMSL